LSQDLSEELKWLCQLHQSVCSSGSTHEARFSLRKSIILFAGLGDSWMKISESRKKELLLQRFNEENFEEAFDILGVVDHLWQMINRSTIEEMISYWAQPFTKERLLGLVWMKRKSFFDEAEKKSYIFENDHQRWFWTQEQMTLELESALLKSKFQEPLTKEEQQKYLLTQTKYDFCSEDSPGGEDDSMGYNSDK
jgi:hypothetical protein